MNHISTNISIFLLFSFILKSISSEHKPSLWLLVSHNSFLSTSHTFNFRRRQKDNLSRFLVSFVHQPSSIFAVGVSSAGVNSSANRGDSSLIQRQDKLWHASGFDGKNISG